MFQTVNQTPAYDLLCCTFYPEVTFVVDWGLNIKLHPSSPPPHPQTTSMTILSLTLSFCAAVCHCRIFPREIQALYIFPRASQSGHPPLLENSARTKLMNVQTGTGTGPCGCETWQADEDATTTTAAAAQPPPSSQPNNFLH